MSDQADLEFDEICMRGSVHEKDVLALRRRIYGRNGIDANDVDQLFKINGAARVQGSSWPPFFIEAVTDFVVNDLAPQGYVTAANAAWLIERVSHDGIVDAKNELELLVNILDRARWAPGSLVKFVLEQVKQAVVSGGGPLRANIEKQQRHITEADVRLIRRVLYAFGGDGNVAITRAEAEVLFDIEDATSAQPQPAAWQELFVKAIANAIMTASGYCVPSREEALRQEVWLQSRDELDITSVLARLFQTYHIQSTQERALARLERQRIEIITNEEVTEGEAGWLAERIGRNDRITENERLLLEFLKRESPQIHPALRDLVDQSVVAA